MFDQQMFLATRRHLAHKGRPYHFVHGGDAVSGQHHPEIDQNTSLREDEETSMEELSITSFSSSSNSSFSAPDCNKSTQQEALPFSQTSKPEKSFIVLPSIKNSNIDPCRLLDFRNVIRDSINRGFNASKSFNESNEQMHINMTLPTPLNCSESLGLSSPSSCSEFKEYFGFSHGRSEVLHRYIDDNGSTCSSKLKPNLNNVQQSTNHKRSASVIAKLMGLETMPQEPVLQNSNSLLKPICKTRNLVENAPWKKNGKFHLQHDDKLSTHQDDNKGIKKVEDSVYKEIERKLIELEAVKSNRDLRALKQILDAMEEKGLFEPERNDQKSYQSSPIVIMKPVNSAKRLNVSSSISRSSSTTHGLQSQTSFDRLSNKQPFNSRLREISEMKTSNKMVQRSGSIKPPRLPKEKLIKEISHASYSFPSTNNRQSESGKLKLDKAKDCHEPLLLNKKKIEVKTLNHPRKEFPQRSEKDVPTKKLKKPSIKVSQEIQTNAEENTSAEQPSPVSVLDDSSVYQDSPESPSNDNSNCYKHGENQNKKSASRMKHMKKFENIENLLQKLDDLSTSSNNYNGGGSTDHIASLSGIQNPKPNHRYVSQVLLASGILFQDTESQIQLHSSGFPINPDLFLVLEQTNACNNKNNNNGAEKEKLDRKLIFDLVNETLMKKVMDVNRSRGQQLIKDLCGEIDALMQVQSMALRNEDCSEVVQKSEGWVNFKEVVPGLVLEVERLIFKDLIVQVINDEVDCNSKLKSNVSSSFINQQ